MSNKLVASCGLEHSVLTSARNGPPLAHLQCSLLSRQNMNSCLFSALKPGKPWQSPKYLVVNEYETCRPLRSNGTKSATCKDWNIIAKNLLTTPKQRLYVRLAAQSPLRECEDACPIPKDADCPTPDNSSCKTIASSILWADWKKRRVCSKTPQRTNSTIRHCFIRTRFRLSRSFTVFQRICGTIAHALSQGKHAHWAQDDDIWNLDRDPFFEPWLWVKMFETIGNRFDRGSFYSRKRALPLTRGRQQNSGAEDEVATHLLSTVNTEHLN